MSKLAGALKARGVEPGDRVGGYLPNMPETIIAMLAAVSLGATWSSCSPDFGVQGVVDRFGQIEPKVMICADGYYYNGKAFNSLDKVAGIQAAVSSIQHIIVVPYTRTSPSLEGLVGAVMLGDATVDQAGGPITFAQMPFDHPLYHVFIGYDGRTQVYRPRCGWYVTQTPGRARTPSERKSGRSSVLFHHMRLDDVELVSLGTGR